MKFTTFLYFRYLNSNRSNKTFKPKKNIPEGTHQYDLMKHAAATLGKLIFYIRKEKINFIAIFFFYSLLLGSGNLRNAVQLPEGEDVNEWIAVNSKLIND